MNLSTSAFVSKERGAMNLRCLILAIVLPLISVGATAGQSYRMSVAEAEIMVQLPGPVGKWVAVVPHEKNPSRNLTRFVLANPPANEISPPVLASEWFELTSESATEPLTSIVASKLNAPVASYRTSDDFGGISLHFKWLAADGVSCALVAVIRQSGSYVHVVSAFATQRDFTLLMQDITDYLSSAVIRSSGK